MTVAMLAARTIAFAVANEGIEQVELTATLAGDHRTPAPRPCSSPSSQAPPRPSTTWTGATHSRWCRSL